MDPHTRRHMPPAHGSGYTVSVTAGNRLSDTVTPRHEGIVTTFLTALLFVTGILLLSGLPVFVMAWRRGRTAVALRFLIAAGVIGLFFGAVALSSQRLVEQCGASGSLACFDVGFKGLLLVVVIIYLIVSVAAAVRLARG